MTHILTDPAHWQARADDARRLSGELTDPEAKRMMIGIAEGYSRLAERARIRAVKDSD